MPTKEGTGMRQWHYSTNHVVIPRLQPSQCQMNSVRINYKYATVMYVQAVLQHNLVSLMILCCTSVN